MEITAFMGRLLSAITYITLDGSYVSADSGEALPIAYDPTYDEYTVMIAGRHFDIFPHEFQTIT